MLVILCGTTRPGAEMRRVSYEREMKREWEVWLTGTGGSWQGRLGNEVWVWGRRLAVKRKTIMRTKIALFSAIKVLKQIKILTIRGERSILSYSEHMKYLTCNLITVQHYFKKPITSCFCIWKPEIYLLVQVTPQDTNITCVCIPYVEDTKCSRCVEKTLMDFSHSHPFDIA